MFSKKANLFYWKKKKMSENAIDNQQIQVLLRKLENLSPKGMEKALKLIGNDQLTSVLDTFAANGRPKRWEGLKPWTRIVRAKKGKWGNWRDPYDGRILQVTGSYIRSWNYKLIQDGVAIGTGDSRAKILNDGGTNDKGFQVPARKQDVVMPQDITKHIDTLNKKIQEVINS